MASGIDPKFLNVDFNQNIEKTGLYKFTKKGNYFVLDLDVKGFIYIFYKMTMPITLS